MSVCLEGTPSPGPLGMQDSTITWTQLSSSSSFGADYRNRYARLENSKYWATLEENPSDPWFEVDLLDVHVITGIQTQGAGSGHDNEYVKKLNIAYGESSADSYILESDGDIEVRN